MFLMSSFLKASRLEPLFMCKMAKNMWNNLYLIHKQKSMSKKIALLQKFYKYNIAPGDSFEQRATKMYVCMYGGLSI
jgi:hypothetical protein